MKGLVIFSGSKPNMKNLQAWSTENKKAAIVVNHLFNKTCRKIYAIKTWGEFLFALRMQIRKCSKFCQTNNNAGNRYAILSSQPL